MPQTFTKTPMIKVRLRRIKSNHKNLRTDEVDGECWALPEVGKPFHLEGEALDPVLAAAGGRRYIDTTPVKQAAWVWKDHIMLFETEYSTYTIDIQENIQ